MQKVPTGQWSIWQSMGWPLYRLVWLLAGSSYMFDLNAQPLSATQLAQINQLYHHIEQNLIKPTSSNKPCIVSRLQRDINNGTVSIDDWLRQVEILQTDGDSLCTSLVLATLRPIAKRDPVMYRRWLRTQIHFLETHWQTDSAWVRVVELEEVSRTDRLMSGWMFCEKAKLLNQKIQFERAIRAGNEALLIARDENDKRLEAEALTILGQTSRDIYRQIPAKYRPYLEQASAIAQSLNDSVLLSRTNRYLVYAHMYDHRADIEAILPYLEQGLPYLQQQHNKLAQYRFVFAFTDAISYFPSQYDKAVRLYTGLVQLAKQFRLTRDIRFLYQYLGSMAIDHQQLRQGAAYLDSASRYDTPDWEKDHFYQDQANVQEKLGNVLLANQ